MAPTAVKNDDPTQPPFTMPVYIFKFVAGPACVWWSLSHFIEYVYMQNRGKGLRTIQDDGWDRLVERRTEFTDTPRALA